MEQLEFFGMNDPIIPSDPDPDPQPDPGTMPQAKRERRPKWMIEQEKQDKEIRHERRERKRSEREARRIAREKKRKRREGVEQIKAEVEANMRQLRPLGNVMYCESCRSVKYESSMFSDSKCYACEYKISEEVST